MAWHDAACLRVVDEAIGAHFRQVAKLMRCGRKILIGRGVMNALRITAQIAPLTRMLQSCACTCVLSSITTLRVCSPLQKADKHCQATL